LKYPYLLLRFFRKDFLIIIAPTIVRISAIAIDKMRMVFMEKAFVLGGAGVITISLLSSDACKESAHK